MVRGDRRVLTARSSRWRGARRRCPARPRSSFSAAPDCWVAIRPCGPRTTSPNAAMPRPPIPPTGRPAASNSRAGSPPPYGNAPRLLGHDRRAVAGRRDREPPRVRVIRVERRRLRRLHRPEAERDRARRVGRHAGAEHPLVAGRLMDGRRPVEVRRGQVARVAVDQHAARRGRARGRTCASPTARTPGRAWKCSRRRDRQQPLLRVRPRLGLHPPREAEAGVPVEHPGVHPVAEQHPLDPAA